MEPAGGTGEAAGRALCCEVGRLCLDAGMGHLFKKLGDKKWNEKRVES